MLGLFCFVFGIDRRPVGVARFALVTGLAFVLVLAAEVATAPVAYG